MSIFLDVQNQAPSSQLISNGAKLPFDTLIAPEPMPAGYSIQCLAPNGTPVSSPQQGTPVDTFMLSQAGVYFIEWNVPLNNLSEGGIITLETSSKETIQSDVSLRQGTIYGSAIIVATAGEMISLVNRGPNFTLITGFPVKANLIIYSIDDATAGITGPQGATGPAGATAGRIL